MKLLVTRIQPFRLWKYFEIPQFLSLLRKYVLFVTGIMLYIGNLCVYSNLAYYLNFIIMYTIVNSDNEI